MTIIQTASAGLSKNARHFERLCIYHEIWSSSKRSPGAICTAFLLKRAGRGAPITAAGAHFVFVPAPTLRVGLLQQILPCSQEEQDGPQHGGEASFREAGSVPPNRASAENRLHMPDLNGCAEGRSSMPPWIFLFTPPLWQNSSELKSKKSADLVRF